MRLLVVEDDRNLNRSLKSDLTAAGFVVDVVEEGHEALYMGEEEPYDLIILDLGLPGLSGLEILRTWRAKGIHSPVIILTARDAWQEKVAGFRAGADDYLAKPFHIEELLVRIEAIIRRGKNVAGGSPLTAQGMVLDETDQCIITPDGTRHRLTGMEFRLLRYFMLHPGRILSKTVLTDHLYEYDQDKDSNVLEVYVRRLRKIVGDEMIATQRGQGYRFGNKL